MAREQPRLVIGPTILPVINVASGIMPLPAVISLVALNKSSPPMMRLLDEIRTNQVPYVFAVMSKPGIDKTPERFFTAGVVCSVKADSDTEQILVKGEYKVRVTSNFRPKDGFLDSYWTVSVTLVQDENIDTLFVDPHYHNRIRADLIKIKHLLQRLYNEGIGFWDFPSGGDLISNLIDGFENQNFNDKDAVDRFVWLSIAALPELLQEDKQPFLESANLLERIAMLIKLLKSHTEVLDAYKRGSRDGKNSGGLNQTNASQKPKDEEDKIFEKVHPEIRERWKKFKEIRPDMTEAAQKVAFDDLRRLVSYGGPVGNSHEWPKFSRRLDLTLEYPWKAESKPKEDIDEVAKILDEDHHGLERPKQKICDQIAPRILNPAVKSQIICFVGAPGVGKTSLAKSIAKALGLKLIRISVGGTRDEAQIKGHNITYSGSQPGEIIREMIRAGVKNPVFVIDEIDKVGHDSIGGNPSAALLEVLDPEQNNSFKDHYLDYGVDLSKVFFIATANLEDPIIPALRDRMDIIHLPSYLEVEKMEIAKRYLIPRWIRDVGLEQAGVKIEWTDEIILMLIKSYTREAGVRNLERNIATILRRLARRHLESRKGDVIKEFKITRELITNLMGPEKFSKKGARPTLIGEAIGLAWTSVGGDILYIQAEFYDKIDGKKVLDLTGMQGAVMRESDKLALTRLRNILRATNPELADKLKNTAIHLHIPEGAVPKDGPSAGIAIFSALYSQATGKLVKQSLAMTGEIDNKARVLPVGGIREKVYAAERAGIIEVVMPKENQRNLYDVPKEVKEKLKFHFVETIDEVIGIVFP